MPAAAAASGAGLGGVRAERGHCQPETVTPPASLKGLMLQDLVSAKLISDYTVVEIPDSVNDLQGTTKVRGPPF